MDHVFPNQQLLSILPILTPRLEGKGQLLNLLLPVAKEGVEKHIICALCFEKLDVSLGQGSVFPA